MSRAYVYSLTVDGVVRYIGKGTGRRVTDHLRLAKAYVRRKAAGETVTATYLQRRLASAWRDGKDIEETILRAGLSDEEAFDIEAFLIAQFPDGHLWNLAPGGAGVTSDLARARWQDPVYRAKFEPFLADPAWRKARAAATKAALRARFAEDPSEAQRMGRQTKAAWARPGAKAARSAKMSADRRLPSGPTARVLAAIGERGATLDQICEKMPDLDRRLHVVKTLNKLATRREIEKVGGKYDGIWRKTNIVSLAS